MMVFEDFDVLQERRKAERARRLKKRFSVVGITTLVAIIIIAGGAFAFVSVDEKDDSGVGGKSESSSKGNNAKSAPVGPAKEVSRVQKMIKTLCNSTNYKDSCEKTLEKSAKRNPNPQRKELLKSVIAAAAEELEKAFAKASSLKFDSPEEKKAFEVCQAVVADAKEELQLSVDKIAGEDTAKNLTDGDVSNLLSAVMSYHETCVDAFPEGKLKLDMKSALDSSEELTSNSLAILKQLGSLPSSLTAGVPHWVDRRVLKSTNVKPTPNVTVAKDGSGNFSTISEALKAIPEKYQGRYVIFVKAGTYEETVNVTKKMVNLTIYGEGSRKSIITGNKNFVDGVPTYLTATFVASGEGFLGQAMGFRNMAGPEKHQAVAARVQADRAIFQNCRFEGFQDTLYVQAHRQFYRACVISGTVDFIFGDAAAVFQNCEIQIRKPMENQQNIVTAQGRKDKFETTGIVLQNCEIYAHPELAPVKDKFMSYLGRPWKEFSRTVVMETKIEDLIDPEGWKEWNGTFALSTLYYAEYNNNGPGAKTDGRVKWAGRKDINKEEASRFSVAQFLQGGAWIQELGTSVRFGLGS